MEGGRQPSVPPKIGNLGAVAICIKPGSKKKKSSDQHTAHSEAIETKKYEIPTELKSKLHLHMLYV